MNTSFARLRWAAALLTLTAAGCPKRPLGCDAGTLQLVLSFDAATAAADQMTTNISVPGATEQQHFVHTPGETTQTLLIVVPNYTAGQPLSIEVIASVGSNAVGGASTIITLAPSCTEQTLQLYGPTTTAGDMGPPGIDMAGYGPAEPLSTTLTNKIDILFMVDNSPSMTAMQAQLQTQFAQFLQPFVDLAALGIYADLHIGVVTSDYGAGDTPGGGCTASPGGENGFLQALGAAAPANCVAPVGSPYISYQFGASGDSSNLPVATSPTQLTTTFGCMASVGAAGCGFEHQLESVTQALRNTKENAGFLRDDAILAVVFFTNEDDGSAPPTTKIYEDTADVATFGAYDTYRQTRFGVACVQGGMLALSPEAASTAPLMGCEAAPDTLFSPGPGEYDVQRYISLFTSPLAQGGVKANPDDVMLLAIDAPETPFETVTVQPGTGLGVAPNPTYLPCSPIGTQCVVRVNHSCQNSVTPAFFGDPAVRLNSVVKQAKFSSISSICGDDPTATPDYSKALSSAGDLLRSRLSGNCVTTKLANPKAPDCEVIATAADGTQTALPTCGQGSTAECWAPISAPSCAGLSPDEVAIELENISLLPSTTTVAASCR